MTIVNMNFTEYMGPDKDGITAYAALVNSALFEGRINPPLTARCPECETDFADLDDAYADELHILVLTPSDTVAVVVACEGYYVVDPNLVGIDSPMWSSPEAQVIACMGDMPS